MIGEMSIAALGIYGIRETQKENLDRLAEVSGFKVAVQSETWQPRVI